MEDNEQRYEIRESMLNEILKYLGSKPYTEVSNLVSKIYGTVGKIDNEPTEESFPEESK